jgi:hypothetical protein
MHSRVNLWKAKHANSHMQKTVHMLYRGCFSTYTLVITLMRQVERSTVKVSLSNSLHEWFKTNTGNKAMISNSLDILEYMRWQICFEWRI